MKKLVVLSGAGISAESGIQTFRDADGLWENHAIEEVATPQAWTKDADLVTRFYNLRREQIIASEPNAAHRFFAELENRFNVHIITQNIDDLHERGGSSQILHLHGNIRYAKSSGPNQEKKYYAIEGWELTDQHLCDDGYRLRPHVVWFGEDVPALNRAAEILSDADVLVVIGTSLNVYPAAGLIHAVPSTCQCFVIDPQANNLSVGSHFTVISTTAVQGVKELEKLL